MHVKIFNPGRRGQALLWAAAMLLLAACGGPRMMMKAERPLPRLDAQANVEVFVGRIEPPFREVAVLDSEAYPYVDDAIKLKMLNELKRKSRQVGANVLHEVRILSKDVNGFTADELVPFTAWKQGQYQLFFMRATALSAPETEPATLAEARPEEGWMVERLAPPARLQALALPGLRVDDAATTAPGPAQP